VVMPKVDTAQHQAEITRLEATLPGTAGRERAMICYNIAGLAYLMGNVREKAQQALTEMHEIAGQLGDLELEVLALNGLSAVHDHIGLRHQSLDEATKAEQIAREMGNERLVALSINSKAQFFKENGKNPAAFGMWREVLDIAERQDDARLRGMALMGMGRATSMADMALGRAYFDQAIEICKVAGAEYALAVCYTNRADSSIYVGDYEEAIDFHAMIADLSARIGDKVGVGRTMVRRAQAFSLLGDYDTAEAYIKTALPLVLSTADIEGELHSYLVMGHLNVVRGDIGRACEYYQRTLDKSLLAPDSACAIFAQRALDEVAEGRIPPPGILPPEPLKKLAQIKDELLLKEVHHILARTYDTADRSWTGFLTEAFGF